MTLLLWLGLLLTSLALVAAGVCAYGSKRWTDATRGLRRSLEAARLDDRALSASAARFDSRELEDLPAPVQRYFRAVLTEGQPIISALTKLHHQPGEAVEPQIKAGLRAFSGDRVGHAAEVSMYSGRDHNGCCRAAHGGRL